MEDKWETINQIREFNRLYTVLLGFLNRNYLDTGYSLTETRILFELKENEEMSANRLIEMLRLDKSYISRLIRNFEQKGMITRKVSQDDRRILVIELTAKGRTEAEKLIAATNHEIYRLIERLDVETCRDLCESMKKITGILSLQGGNYENKR